MARNFTTHLTLNPYFVVVNAQQNIQFLEGWSFEALKMPFYAQIPLAEKVQVKAQL